MTPSKTTQSSVFRGCVETFIDKVMEVTSVATKT